MWYLVISFVFLIIGFRLGRVYQDFQDIMLARRVARLVEQRQRVSVDLENYEEWEKQDRRFKKRSKDAEEVI